MQLSFIRTRNYSCFGMDEYPLGTNTVIAVRAFLLKGTLCAYVIRLWGSYNQNEETPSRSSLRYLSKANLGILERIISSCRAPSTTSHSSTQYTNAYSHEFSRH